jgi:hypothetical protein
MDTFDTMNRFNTIHMDRVRAGNRVPAEEIPDLAVLAVTSSFKIAVTLVDVGVKEAKIRFPRSIGVDLIDPMTTILLDIRCRDKRFQIQGTLSPSSFESTLETRQPRTAYFRCNPDSCREWTTISYWLQVQWLKEFARLESAAENLDLE